MRVRVSSSLECCSPAGAARVTPFSGLRTMVRSGKSASITIVLSGKSVLMTMVRSGSAGGAAGATAGASGMVSADGDTAGGSP